jgi:hypothetical protein
MSSVLRVVAAVALSFLISVALNAALERAGLNIGPAAHPNVQALATKFAASLVIAGLVGYLCARLSGVGRVLPATAGLMVAYMLLGIRSGRQLIAAGEAPFSSAILTLLCISVVPVGAALFVSRATRTMPGGR